MHKKFGGKISFNQTVHSLLLGKLRKVVPISNRVDRASSTEAVNWGSIPFQIKLKTIKIGIHSFPPWRLAIKGTVWSLRR